jgi:pyridoxal phosphate enzyme (YggS family)
MDGQDRRVDGGADDDRRAEIAGNLERVRARIAAACADAGRDPGEVTLIVVTKTFPADDVRLLAELGVADVGENRDQEAAPKVEACADLNLRWHFVGQLQTNKVRSVVTYANVVHSVDRPRLVTALDRAMSSSGRPEPLRTLVQVNLDGEPGRGGAEPGDVQSLANQIAAAEHLDLAGVMAVAPLGADPVTAFAELVRVSVELRRDHPGAAVISAGMSADLEAAVTAGATHLRVGSGVLGRRPSSR